MHKYATSFLCAFALWNLWGASAINGDISKHTAALSKPPMPYYTIENLGVHQQHWFVYNSLRQNGTSARIDNMMQRIEMRLQALQSQVDALLQSLKQQIPPYIENIKKSYKINTAVFTKGGLRHFYLEKQSMYTWDDAYVQCRQMGGHLASIQNEKELNEIFAEAPSNQYWVDITNRHEDGAPFLSALSGRKAPLLKWKSKKSTNTHHHCVYIYAKDVYYDKCYEKKSFVCQAEQWA
ncbi:accessory gland protein Acp29AB [Drosophila erecta]|uniref:C-type lectin domain-containing protein n=1 Tax=Drosophila erecta TaxID=7220 RepID=B3N7F4_DROER|nr:accessory gland protein Acp29AB [Drosophila erecta]EDV59359.2 uncharacterized protein Dere_GG23444 [Drosophila erecta]